MKYKTFWFFSSKDIVSSERAVETSKQYMYIYYQCCCFIVLLIKTKGCLSLTHTTEVINHMNKIKIWKIIEDVLHMLYIILKKNYGMSEVVISYQFWKCHHRDRRFFVWRFFLFICPGIRRSFLNTPLHVIFAKTTLMLNG